MGGTPHGRHSIVINKRHLGYDAQFQYCAAALYRALEHLRVQGVCQRVAAYTDGSGGGWPGDGDAIGSNGFLVYRWPLTALRTNWFWEILFEWHGQYAWNDTGQRWTPSLLNNGDGGNGLSFGFQVAVGFDSGDNPVSSWTGSTNFDWNDYKGTTPTGTEIVWAVSGGTAHVLPSSNATTHVTYKQNCAAWIWDSQANWDDNPKRFHVIADEDSLYMGCDYEDDGSIANHLLVTPYTPLDGITVDPPLAPLVAMVMGPSGFVYDTTYGGVSTGGVIAPNPGQPVDLYTPSFARNLGPDLFWNPNNQRDNPLMFEQSAPIIGVNQTSVVGLLGTLWDDFMTMSWGLPNMSTWDSKQRVVLGSSDQHSFKMNLPWDGVSSDANGASDENGISF